MATKAQSLFVSFLTISIFLSGCGQKYSIGIGAVPLDVREQSGENQAPTLAVLPGETADVQTNKPFTFLLLGNDPEGTNLVYTLKGAQAANYTATKIAERGNDRFLNFSASSTQGKFDVTVEVCDSAEVPKCISKLVSVLVSTTPSNAPPVLLVAEPARSVGDGSTNNPFAYFAYDPDGDAFTITIADTSTASIGQSWLLNQTTSNVLLTVPTNVSGTVNAVLSAKDAVNPATTRTLTGTVINNFCNTNQLRYLSVKDFSGGTGANNNTIVLSQSTFNPLTPFPNTPNLQLELTNTGSCDLKIRIGLPPRNSINLIVDALSSDPAGTTEFEYASFDISNVSTSTLGGKNVYTLAAGQKSMFTLRATNKRKVHSRTNVALPGADSLYFYYHATDPTSASAPMIPRAFNVHVQ